MSYILDALKKSEEERHQGQVPNLGSNSTLIHSPKTKSSTWPWVIVVLLVLNVSFVGFWVLNERSASPLSADNPTSIGGAESVDPQNRELLDVQTASQKLLPAVEDTAVTEQTSIAEQAIVEEQRVVDVQEVIKKKVVKPTTLERIGTSDAIKHSLTKSEAAPLSRGMIAKPELIVPGGGYQSTMVKEESVVIPDEEAPLLITPKGKSRPYNGPAYTPEVADSINTTQVSEEGASTEVSLPSSQSMLEDIASIERLSDKPHDFQIQVPDMAFNSHIYTDTPSSRRVMINNIYLREGQTFSGMKVEQITEEGIVLSLDDEPFKMGVLRDWYSPR